MILSRNSNYVINFTYTHVLIQVSYGLLFKNGVESLIRNFPFSIILICILVKKKKQKTVRMCFTGTRKTRQLLFRWILIGTLIFLEHEESAKEYEA